MASVNEQLAEGRRNADLREFFLGNWKRAAATAGFLVISGCVAMTGWQALNDNLSKHVKFDESSYSGVALMGAVLGTALLYGYYKVFRRFRPMGAPRSVARGSRL